MKVIYCDMVADLFHYGHVNFLKQCSELGDLLIVGIHSDKDVESYKRKPILSFEERVKVVQACKYVDKVIPNAPLFITHSFLQKHSIGKVVTTERSNDELQWYKIPAMLQILVQIPYSDGISTTEIIKRIHDRNLK